MVYLHFPSNLTEEEMMLQGKYQKLRKKKKAVVALKAPKTEPEKPALTRGGAQVHDAREHARKLFKSGAISAIPSPPAKHSQHSFKRPRAGRERKLSGPGSLDKVVSSYQPFSAMQDPVDDKSPPRNNSLYDSLVVAREKEDRTEVKSKTAGTTIHIQGRKISEDYLRKHLSQHGTIINISMEIEKDRGFVTFEKSEVAQKLISEMHGTTVGGIRLEVTMARRQPQMERINEASSSSAWSTLATSHSQKGQHRNDRTQVVYDDDLFST